ncbi:MAG: hypothetical protein KAQ91_10645 [Methylococcales bacterium]|nr:hypothetical protein [Methylococcales bacterium]
MTLPPKVIHPQGDQELIEKAPETSTLVADTFDGKLHIVSDTVNAKLLGMTKVVSDDCARRALQKAQIGSGL